MKPVLIVDDEPDLRSVLQDILQVCGYPVVTAGNGREALDYLLGDDAEPSLIFLDLTMPVMNGLKFLEELHSGAHPRLARIPVVVVSAVEEFIVLKRFPCVGILKKPADIEKILGLAERFTRRTYH